MDEPIDEAFYFEPESEKEEGKTSENEIEEEEEEQEQMQNTKDEEKGFKIIIPEKEKIKVELPQEFKKYDALTSMMEKLTKETIKEAVHQIKVQFDIPRYVLMVGRTLIFYFDTFPQKKNLVVEIAINLCQSFGTPLAPILLNQASGMFLYRLYKENIFSLQAIKRRCSLDKRIFFFFIPELGVPYYSEEFRMLFQKIPEVDNESIDDSENNYIEFIYPKYKNNNFEVYERLRTSGYEEGSVQGAIHKDEVAALIEYASTRNFDPYTLIEESPFITTDKRKYNLMSYVIHYHAITCFNYLLKKGIQINEISAIEGCRSGNMEILEQIRKLYPLNNMIRYSLCNHNPDIISWFKYNISENNYSAEDCLMNFNVLALGELMKSEDFEFTPNCLHYAVWMGSIDIVQVVMKSIKDINVKDERGNTALHTAVKLGSYSLCSYILNNGADPNIKGENGDTPLYIACLMGNLDVAQLLIENDADIFIRNDNNDAPMNAAVISNVKAIIDVLNSFHAELSSLNPPTYTAIRCGNLAAFDALLDLGASPDAIVDDKGNTLMHKASCKADHRFAKILLYNECDFGRSNKEGDTPLVYAYMRGDTALTKLLTKKGTNVRRRYSLGRSIAHFCAIGGAIDAMQWIKKVGINLDSADNTGKTPIIYALLNKKYDMVRYLISVGVNLKVKSDGGYSIMHWVAEYEMYDIFSDLVVAGADINDEDHRMWSPLCIAAQKNCLQMVNLLLQAEAFFKTKTSETTPAHIAAEYDHIEIVKRFLLLGLDTDFTTDNGETMLHCAARSNAINTVPYLLSSDADPNARDGYNETPLTYAAYKDYLDVMRMLLRSRADPNTTTPNGEPIFFWCVKNNRIGAAKLLIKFNANVNILDKEQHTICMIAAMEGKANWIDFFVSVGGNALLEDSNGNDALLFAAKANSIDCIRSLIDAKADVDHQNDKGEAAIHFAVQNNNFEMIELLLQEGADPFVEDDDNNNAFSFIGDENELEMWRTFVNYGFEVNGAFDDENPHLVLAAISHNVEKLDFLLNHGADVDVRDIDGKTALYHTVTLGDEKLTRYLMKHGADMNADCDGVTPFEAALNEGRGNIVWALEHPNEDYPGDELARDVSTLHLRKAVQTDKDDKDEDDKSPQVTFMLDSSLSRDLRTSDALESRIPSSVVEEKKKEEEEIEIISKRKKKNKKGAKPNEAVRKLTQEEKKAKRAQKELRKKKREEKAAEEAAKMAAEEARTDFAARLKRFMKDSRKMTAATIVFIVAVFFLASLIPKNQVVN